MRKIVFYFIALLAFFSCSNDNNEFDVTDNQVKMALTKNEEFIRLIDNQTQDAGLLKFETKSGASQANVEWIVSEGFNLDTTQTVLSLKDGKGELPIRWIGKTESGNYGPSDIVFKGGVVISVDNESKYFPLVWAYAVDSLKLSSNVQTRAAGVEPCASSLRFVPQEVEMNSNIGAVMVLVGTDISFAVLNYSTFSSKMNVNLAELPTFVERVSGLTGFNTQLKFTWTAAGAPTQGFEAYVYVETDNGLTARGTVKYGKIPSLDVSPLEVTLSDAGGNNIAVSKVTTNELDWVAVSNQTWLRVTPESGKTGSYALYFSADPNPYKVERYATVKVTTGNLSQNITIIQKGKPSTEITPNSGNINENWGNEDKLNLVID